MQILEKNDADLDRKWSTYFGNKRYLKRPIARVYSALPSPRKRKKLNKQEHSIGDAKQSAGGTPAPLRPEYRFIARNTMFPDPKQLLPSSPFYYHGDNDQHADKDRFHHAVNANFTLW